MRIEVKKRAGAYHIYEIWCDGKRLKGMVRRRKRANHFAVMMAEALQLAGRKTWVVVNKDDRFD
jgi:hypothetical protein